MNTKRITIFAYLFLLLATVVGGSSACSHGPINAQSSNRQTTETARAAAESNAPETSAAPAYKPPKRVSKDIIKKDEKAAKTHVK